MDSVFSMTRNMPPKVRTLVSAIRACNRFKAPPQVKAAVHWHVGRILEKQYLPCSSTCIAKMVGGKYYRMFLDIMDSIPEIRRDHGYLSRGLLKQLNMNPSLARCKAYYIPQTAGENTLVLSTARVSVSRRLLDRFRSCFGLAVHDSGSVGLTCLFAGQVVYPDLSFGYLLSVCDSRASASAVFEYLESARAGFRSRLGGDGRTYHGMTGLKKELRSQCFLGSRAESNRVVAVDAHAAHVAILASEFAPPDERDRLVDMLRTGNFYREFAVAAGRASPVFAGLKALDVKTNFLANVLYKFASNSRIWKAFAYLFPVTARRLSKFRDSNDWIIKRPRKEFQDRYGRKQAYRAKTRIGQFRLSRLFCRIEGEIFRGAQKLLSMRGILTAPLHDSLLIAQEHVEEAKSVVEQQIQQVLGFALPVKTES